MHTQKIPLMWVFFCVCYSILMEFFSTWMTDVFFGVVPVIRALLIFLFSYGEGLPVVGSLLPGGTIALLVGSLSESGFINPLFAIGIIAFGSFLGDITGFFIGRKYKHARWLRKLIDHEKHQNKWDIFDRHIALIVIFGKLVPVVRSTPSFFAGARNIRVQKYFLLSFTGSLLWAFAGVYGGSALSKLFGVYAVPIIIGILVVSGIVALFVKKRKKVLK